MSTRPLLGALICAIVGCCAASAQTPTPSASPPTPTRPPISQVQEYQTSVEEYEALKKKARGGTKQTAATLPDWSGLWRRKPRGPFYAFDESAPVNTELPDYEGAYATVTVPLTPKYLADYKEQVKAIKEDRGWDRLSWCMPAGFPRWLLEPHLREFILTPTESFLNHEQFNELRRIYTDGREHAPAEEVGPLWLGDSIGFWDKDALVIHTQNVKAGYYHRGLPAYSFQTSTVEQWRKIDPDTIMVKVTVYDPPALLKPWHGEFFYTKMKDPKLRAQYVSCVEGNNIFRGPDGKANYILPGEPGYKDAETFGIPEVTLDTLPR